MADPICTCNGPARDAHDKGRPVRRAYPRLDLGDAPHAPTAHIRPAVGGAGGAAGPRLHIGRDTTVTLTLDGRAKPPPIPPVIHRALERMVYDDPPGSDGDGKAWWGKALADGWITEPICRDTEADAGVCEPHRDVCDNWSAAFPLSAPDGVCGGGR